MAKFVFKKATKYQTRLRLALIGPSGSGKTYSSIKIGQFLVKPGEGRGEGGRVKIRGIDTERRSMSKYVNLFPGVDLEVIELEDFAPQTYIDALEAAQSDDGGCDVTIVDSASHAWMGKGGVLEQLNTEVKRSQSKNSFDAWRTMTPIHNQLVDAMLGHKAHLIVTMRTKTEYVIEENDRGKKVPRKIGLAPVQRDGLEYEFDVIGDMNLENDLIIGKTRCSALAGKVFSKPGEDLGTILRDWLTDGAAPAPEAEAEKPKDTRSEDEKHPQWERINRTEFKEIFDQLGTTIAARLQAADKYRADDKLREVIKKRLEERLKEREAEQKKQTQAAEPPKQEGGVA